MTGEVEVKEQDQSFKKMHTRSSRVPVRRSTRQAAKRQCVVNLSPAPSPAPACEPGNSENPVAVTVENHVSECVLEPEDEAFEGAVPYLRRVMESEQDPFEVANHVVLHVVQSEKDPFEDSDHVVQPEKDPSKDTKPAQPEEDPPKDTGRADSSTQHEDSFVDNPAMEEAFKHFLRPIKDANISPIPGKMCRGIMSDSSDSDYEPRQSLTPVSLLKVKVKEKKSDSESSDEEIFNINYSAHNAQALKSAYQELSTTVGELNQSLTSNTSDVHIVESEDECWIEEPISPKKHNTSEVIECSPSPPLFDIDCTRHPRKRMSRKKWSAQRKKKFDDSLNISSVIQVLDDDDGDEEDVNPEIRLSIKWDREIFRLPIRKLQKFSHLYEELAKKYRVSQDCVVLNFNDKIISPDLCPSDLQMTIADIIEGGVSSLQSSNGSCPPLSQPPPPPQEAVTLDSNSILLRVQNSKKKGSLAISIGLKEKMHVLMHKYAEEKRLCIDKLRFMFDGEQLHPRSTPSSLDMEGGECIDVYELT